MFKMTTSSNIAMLTAAILLMCDGKRIFFSEFHCFQSDENNFEHNGTVSRS
jgi:hypothetical protein